MLCPHCNKEMVKGSAVFLGNGGVTSMLCSFTAEAEKDKSIFSREDSTKVVLQGFENEAYYCEDCKITLTVIK